MRSRVGGVQFAFNTLTVAYLCFMTCSISSKRTTSEAPTATAVQWLSLQRQGSFCWLLQGSALGVRVWDVSSAVCREVLAVRTNESTRSGALFGTTSSEGSLSPSLALVPVDSGDVRIFNTQQHHFTAADLPCHEPVQAVAGSAAHLVVHLAREVRVHEAASLREVLRLSCYPAHHPHEALIALGEENKLIPHLLS